MAKLKRRDVVYGVYADELVFIPANRAHGLAKTWKALTRAKNWGQLKKLAPRLAYAEIRRMQEDPRSIRSWHAFDYYTMTPVPDGDYPGFPKQEVTDWMPTEIWQTFGLITDTAINGTYPSFAPSDGPEIIQRLRNDGFHCRRNQRLVEAAHGD